MNQDSNLVAHGDAPIAFTHSRETCLSLRYGIRHGLCRQVVFGHHVAEVQERFCACPEPVEADCRSEHRARATLITVYCAPPAQKFGTQKKLRCRQPCVSFKVQALRLLGQCEVSSGTGRHTGHRDSSAAARRVLAMSVESGSWQDSVGTKVPRRRES